ncbi:helix-turn-helix transcriptional regulator [Subtercola sp. PAMC28395]|uniref:ArsR/SmtB family transcription factor n=1 Tax=Subtercola sp. PAMC28395 TaxID=2846775 RepID=UPI00209A7F92|nr:metalloregulator ArsR/SmtB family transcription factor [Subtercola sp. PAMC28395]
MRPGPRASTTSSAFSSADPFDALGDPHRRRILDVLSAEELSVGEIANLFPISRPAISRHLRILDDAGLVESRREGTRQIYRLHADGIEAVRAYLDRVWGESAARFALFAENTAPANAAVAKTGHGSAAADGAASGSTSSGSTASGSDASGNTAPASTAPASTAPEYTGLEDPLPASSTPGTDSNQVPR